MLPMEASVAYLVEAAPLPTAASTIAVKAAFAIPKASAYANTLIVKDAVVRGAAAIPTATTELKAPDPKKSHHLPKRSAIHPPATEPKAPMAPLKTPVTNATISGLTFHSGAIP